MAGRVLLAEDFAARLFAVENIPMVGYDRCIAWYEVGTGVSTNEAPAPGCCATGVPW